MNNKYNVSDQLSAFEKYKTDSKINFDNLAPLNVNIKNYNLNKYKGVKNTPFFGIEKRYTTKQMKINKENTDVTLFHE